MTGSTLGACWFVGAAAKGLSDADFVLIFGTIAGGLLVLLMVGLIWLTNRKLRQPHQGKSGFGWVVMVLSPVLCVPLPAWLLFEHAQGTLKDAMGSIVIVSLPLLLVMLWAMGLSWLLLVRGRKKP